MLEQSHMNDREARKALTSLTDAQFSDKYYCTKQQFILAEKNTASALPWWKKRAQDVTWEDIFPESWVDFFPYLPEFGWRLSYFLCSFAGPLYFFVFWMHPSADPLVKNDAGTCFGAALIAMLIAYVINWIVINLFLKPFNFPLFAYLWIVVILVFEFSLLQRASLLPHYRPAGELTIEQIDWQEHKKYVAFQRQAWIDGNLQRTPLQVEEWEKRHPFPSSHPMSSLTTDHPEDHVVPLMSDAELYGEDGK